MARRDTQASVVLSPQELQALERDGGVRGADGPAAAVRVVGAGAWVLVRADQLAAGLPALPESRPSYDAPTPAESSAPPASTGPNFVLLNAEARARGFKSALAFRRWCRRHGVLVRCDAGGRMQWVDRRDVDRAVEGFPAHHVGEVHAEAGRSVADFIARQRR